MRRKTIWLSKKEKLFKLVGKICRIPAPAPTNCWWHQEHTLSASTRLKNMKVLSRLTIHRALSEKHDYAPEDYFVMTHIK